MGDEYVVAIGGRVGQRFIRFTGPGLPDTGVHILEQWPEKDKATILHELLNKAYEQGKNARVGSEDPAGDPAVS